MCVTFCETCARMLTSTTYADELTMYVPFCHQCYDTFIWCDIVIMVYWEIYLIFNLFFNFMIRPKS